ncbi:GNS1/SUR4 family protein [Teladorsagia circumcincta]|uniref:Elongation of very long chain fatty acids protein n=1 Tax=Teladorsagia circumcincta TaxID=45464 RepID=A0A2G9UW83_TELCI|nr:GNS1/SUR4 family protein [Teladorsagia circumcincta]
MYTQMTFSDHSSSSKSFGLKSICSVAHKISKYARQAMDHPMMQRLLDVKFDTKRFVSLVTHGGENFPDKEGRKFIADHFDITIQASILYVLVVFGTKFLMRNRQPFSLFVPLNIWNFILAAFSIMGMIKLTPEFWSTVSNKGFQNSYCFAYDFTKGENGYWVFLFIVSKLFELVDTIFIVLRKRPLMFLHCYYFLRSMKINVPGIVAKFITTLQILQFVISCAILAHIGYLVHIAGVPCDFDDNIFILATFMDTTYLILFINFFLKSYVLRGGKSKYQAVQSKSKKTN